MICQSQICENFPCRILNVYRDFPLQGNLHANKPINPIMKKYIITGVMAAVAATSAFAGTVTASKEVAPVEPPCLFRDQELQIDAFGLGDFYRGAGRFNYYGQPNSPGLSGRPAWGGGLGVNYFFARYFGIGIEQDIYGRRPGANNYGDAGYTRWATIGTLYVRYPICEWNLAPYLMIGGGANYGNTPKADFALPGGGVAKAKTYAAGQGFGHVGGGLEYRITENVGLFSDARYLFSGVTGLPKNQLLWRYGVRFAF